ncbi:MAG TPA: metallophosphoesterase [Cyclobacteriaceae bacterium]|nr:metallophosphoesterase [Cyclobacteriaceae bacterium]
MTIQYCSDLHLEFNENSVYLKINPLQPVGDILLLAGDVVPLGRINEHSWFFDFVSREFETVYWVPGNHEYYGFDISTKTKPINEKIRSNVFLVNNSVVTHGDVRFLFSTLWSNISPLNERDIRQGMADFHLIKYGNSRFTPDHFNQLHQEAKKFLSEELKLKSAKTVVVTHHVPTLMNYPEKYKGTTLNEAFASELFDFIADFGPDYWIYGDHHQSVPAFKIGVTELITNQLGYVRRGEHHQFNGDQIISV